MARRASREILRPSAAAIRLIETRQERRNDLAQLDQHFVGAGTHLEQRMGAHAQQQRLERLAAAEQSDVRLRRGRQETAKGVERLRPDGGAVHAFGVVGAARVARREVLLHPRNPLGVALERGVHGADVLLAQRPGLELGGQVVAPAIVQAIGVGHIPRRLLEIGHEPAPLEHLRQHVRDVLARDVRAAELGDRSSP